MKPRQFWYEELGLRLWQSRYNGAMAMWMVINSKIRTEADRALIVVYGDMSQYGYGLLTPAAPKPYNIMNACSSSPSLSRCVNTQSSPEETLCCTTAI